MSLDLFTLRGTVEVEVRDGERKLKLVDYQARKTAEGLNKSERAAGGMSRGLSSIRTGALDTLNGQLSQLAARVPVIGDVLADITPKLFDIGKSDAFDALAGKAERATSALKAAESQVEKVAQRLQTRASDFNEGLRINFGGKVDDDFLRQFRAAGDETAKLKLLVNRFGEDGARSFNAVERAAFQLSKAERDGAASLDIVRGKAAAAASELADVEAEAVAASRGIGLVGAAGLTAAVGVGILAAGFIATSAVAVKGTRDFLDYAGSIHDLSQESGLAAPTISTLAAYAKLAGTDIKSVIPALEVYQKNLSQAAHGNKSAAATFQRFGIDAKESIKNPDLAARELFTTLNKIPNSAERLDAAFKLAGKSGKVLASVALEMGGDFEEAMRAASEWGIVLSEHDVKAADKFGDAVQIMGYKVNGILYSIGRGALPELQRAVNDVTGAVNGAGPAWQRFGREAGVALGGAIRLAAELGNKLQSYLKYRAAVQAILQSNTPGEAASRVQDVTLPDIPVQTTIRDPKAMRAFKEQLLEQKRAAALTIGDVPRGGGRGGGGGGESAFMRQIRAEISILETLSQTAKRTFDKIQGDNEYALKQGAASWDTYRTSVEVALIDLYNAQRHATLKELDATKVNPSLKGLERIAEQKKLQEKLAAQEQEFNDKMTGLTRQAKERDLDFSRRFAEADVRIMEERQRSADLDLARLITEGTKTHVQAVSERFTALSGVAEAQGEVLKADLIRALGGGELVAAAGPQLSDAISEVISNAVNAADAEGLAEGFKLIMSGATNKEMAREALNAVLEFFLKRKQAFQQNNADTRAALVEDFDAWATHADRLRSINDSIVDMEIETADARLRAIEVSTTNKLRAERMRLDFELKAENLRALRVRESLERDIAAEKMKVQAAVKTAEVVAALNNQMLASEAAHYAKREAIVESFLQAQRDKLQEISDVFSDAIIDGSESGWKAALEDVRDFIRQAEREVLRSQIGAMLRALFNLQTAEESPTGKAGTGPENPVMKAIAQALGINTLGAKDQQLAGNTQAVTTNTSETALNTAALDRLSQRLSGGTGAAAQSSADDTAGGAFNPVTWLFDRLRGAMGPRTPGFNPDARDNTPSAVRDAGAEAVNAVGGVGEAMARAVETTGEGTSRGLGNVSRTLLTGLSAIATQIAVGQSGGSFWKGLLMAGASGFINGLTGGLNSDRNEDEGGESGGGGGWFGGSWATGGHITGPGGPTDDKIAAMLSNGEFVLRASAVRAIGVPALEYMNATGRVPAPVRLAAGGLASPTPVAPPVRAGGYYGREGSGGGGRPVVTVHTTVTPDRQGRVRSNAQVRHEVYVETTEAARRNG